MAGNDVVDGAVRVLVQVAGVTVAAVELGGEVQVLRDGPVVVIRLVAPD